MARKSINERLLLETILRSVYVERFKNGSVRKAMSFINSELVPEVVGQLAERLARIEARGADRGPLTTERLRDVAQSMRALLGDGIGVKTAKLLEDDLIDLGKSEARWETGKLRALTSGLGVEMNAPPDSVIQQLVSEGTPFGSTIKEHLDGISRGAAQEIVKELRLGIAQGEGIEQMVRRVQGTIDANYEDGVFEKVRRNVTTVVRTSTNHVVNRARESVMDENSDVVKAVKLVAVLDSRTSVICAARDGEVYPVNEGPRPPFHPNCRTMVVPVMRSWDELGLGDRFQEGDEALDMRESMDGEVPGDVTYEEWLRSQPEGVQRDVLGAARWELWDAGEIDLKDMIDDRSRVLTIEDLDELSNRGR